MKIKLDKHILSLGLYVILYLLFNLIIYFTVGINIDYFRGILLPLKNLPQIYIFLLLFLFQQIVLMSILYICFVYINGGFNGSLKYTKDYINSIFQWKGTKYLFFTIGMVFLYYFITMLLGALLLKYNIKIPGFFGKQNVSTFIGDIQLANTLEYIILFAIVTVIGPLFEELIYRGFITKILIERFSAWGMVLGALIFDLVHMEWAVFGNLFILSFILSYVFYRTRSLYYTFIFHFLINFIALSSTFLFKT